MKTENRITFEGVECRILSTDLKASLLIIENIKQVREPFHQKMISQE